MSLRGNTGTFTVGAGSFTTGVTGGIDLPKSRTGHPAYLVNVSIVAGAANQEPVTLVVLLRLTDPGVDATLRLGDVCGIVGGDPLADLDTEGLDSQYHILLGGVRNTLQLMINNDGPSAAVVRWGYTVEVVD